MNHHKDIFEIMLSGGEVRQDHPQHAAFMQIVSDTLKKVAVMNAYGDPTVIREKLSEIIGSAIDESTGIFAPFYTNFGKHTKIGKNVFINHACSFLDLGGIAIKDNVLIGPKVNLITENHPIDPQNRKSLYCKSILIKKNAWIGTGATILPGVTIGENAIVAAGSVVTKDVLDNTIVAGVPAKQVKEI